MTPASTAEADDFVLTRSGPGDELNVMLTYPEQGGLLGAKLIVQRVAQHWRLVEHSSGPGVEGHTFYSTEDSAVEGAKQLLRAGDAARRLQGGGGTRQSVTRYGDDDDPREED